MHCMTSSDLGGITNFQEATMTSGAPFHGIVAEREEQLVVPPLTRGAMQLHSKDEVHGISFSLKASPMTGAIPTTALSMSLLCLLKS